MMSHKRITEKPLGVKHHSNIKTVNTSKTNAPNCSKFFSTYFPDMVYGIVDPQENVMVLMLNINLPNYNFSLNDIMADWSLSMDKSLSMGNRPFYMKATVLKIREIMENEKGLK